MIRVSLILITALAALLLGADPASAQALSLDFGGSEGSVTGRLLQLLALLTVLSLAPSILLMVTSFTRIVIVLSFLRSAIGLQQTPPNTVLISLALFMFLRHVRFVYVFFLVTPLIVVQLVAAFVFYDRVWETVTRRLSNAVAGEMASDAAIPERFEYRDIDRFPGVPVGPGALRDGQPVLGAVVLHLLAEVTRGLFGQLPGLNLVIYGSVLVLIVMFMPRGLACAGRRWQEWRGRRG